jgi:hypothetical protein
MIQTFLENLDDILYDDITSSNSSNFLIKQKVEILLSSQNCLDTFNLLSNLSAVFRYLLFENIQFCFFHNSITLKYFKGKI